MLIGQGLKNLDQKVHRGVPRAATVFSLSRESEKAGRFSYEDTIILLLRQEPIKERSDEINASGQSIHPIEQVISGGDLLMPQSSSGK